TEYCRDPVLQRELCELLFMKNHERVGEDNQGLSTIVGHCAKCFVDLDLGAGLEGTHRELERPSRSLSLFVLQYLVAILWIVEDCDTGKSRNQFLEHLKPLARQVGRNAGQPGGFAARPRDAGNKTVERIARYRTAARLRCGRLRHVGSCLANCRL